MNEELLIRYGDLSLKGKNKNFFTKMANSLILEKLKDLDVSFKYYGERCYINTKNEPLGKVIDALNHVSGLYSYSLYRKCPLDINEIKRLSLECYDRMYQEGKTFKVEVRRIYKGFSYDTYEIMREVSGYIMSNRTGCKVDVHNPDFTVFIEIRDEGAYILSDSIKGMGGYPTGTGGKALLMMSGGIDSPVAAYELIKQGLTIEIVHFESTPLTSIESAQKVIDLAKKICAYTRGYKVVVHFVPFLHVHQEILDKVKDSYIITIMRRCMYKIASELAGYRHILALANGESVGQVASQTIESMHVINNVTNYPILRPLLTTDKKDIIEIAKKIDTYDISIRPFEDCCTVYVPKSPVIRPLLDEAIEEENKGNFNELIHDAVKHTKRITIHEDTDINLSMLGFTVTEAINEYRGNDDGENLEH